MKYKVFNKRWDMDEECYTSFTADSDEEAIRRFCELENEESLAWDSLRMIEVQVEQKIRRVASLSRYGSDDKDVVVIHDDKSKSLSEIIHETLEGMVENLYSDGAILFDASKCKPEEIANIGEWKNSGVVSGYVSSGNGHGMLDALTRVLTKAIQDNRR